MYRGWQSRSGPRRWGHPGREVRHCQSHRKAEEDLGLQPYPSGPTQEDRSHFEGLGQRGRMQGMGTQRGRGGEASQGWRGSSPGRRHLHPRLAQTRGDAEQGAGATLARTGTRAGLSCGSWKVEGTQGCSLLWRHCLAGRTPWLLLPPHFSLVPPPVDQTQPGNSHTGVSPSPYQAGRGKDRKWTRGTEA